MRFTPWLAPALLVAALTGCGTTPSTPNATSSDPTSNPNTAVVHTLGVSEDRELAAVNRLLGYYNASDGSWNTPTGEAWQPALALDAVINIYQRTRDSRFLDVINKSFARYNGRRSSFFDDDGWYMNAWLRAWDVTGDAKFLTEAQGIFARMTTSWDSTCNGGLWWNTDYTYKNAITNELFMLGAARLHRRSPNGTGTNSYYDWALRSWNWFRNSGMINAQNRINDGLTSGCQNNGQATWTYNQGVILGAAVELYRFGGDRGYLGASEPIAEATINNQVFPGGILKEANCDANVCGPGDGDVFKGIFTQGVARLVNADRNNAPQQRMNTFLNNNAASVWNNDRDAGNNFGLVWTGPVRGVNQATQASATLLLGAVSLLANGGEITNPPTQSGPPAFPDSLTTNQSLTTGGSLRSPDGRLVVTLQTDGNLVLYFRGKPIWAAGIGGRGGTRLTMQPDGNLVVYTPSNVPVWATGTNGRGGTRFTLQNDGNLVVYTASNSPIWASQTCCR
jgi:predicted alpha-1,6-mannanase (GH76 family)